MAKILSDLPIDTLVKDNETRYYDKPITWRIVDKNHSGYSSGAITLMSDKIITVKCIDAKEASNSNSDRRDYGNNRYIHSNIRQWMNSSKGAGEWYSPQHSADAPPNDDNVWNHFNDYDQEAGFLNGFSVGMQNALLPTTLTVGKSRTDGGGTETFVDKIFLASCTEVGLSGDAVCGVKLAAFNSNEARRAYPTPECVSRSEYTKLDVSSLFGYWLRDAYKSEADSNYTYNFNPTTPDDLDYQWVHRGHRGIRPLCNLPSSVLVSDSADNDGAYHLIFNHAPTIPTTITVPGIVRGGANLTINWGISTDEDNNLSGYILERQYNGGEWIQLYKGISRTYTDTITFGWTSVAYRIKAYDSMDAESDYKTSETRNVINNMPPIISGNDSDLGLKTEAFSLTYTVTDPDGGTVAVVEKIDGVQIRRFTTTDVQSYSFDITAAEWVKLLNGLHTLEIVATDSSNDTVIRTYTFQKNETEIEITLKVALSASDIITKAVMSVNRQIPTGATLTIEACNNGNDTSPTWEDVTQAVTSGNKFFFSNTIKTAASWGFNYRIRVNRNGTTGDCFVMSVGGNFE
ncbi:DUF6273 domain-containing protein [Anaeromassilibacillus senegalensis]|uniref:DUF6273 domain-containing protein n=1 Tax=Anaeromassilibacillus senegalensis TaxID=1673717 RepID=UPI0006805CA9|nr:DUF6273 domain-containing protein [Anaeromassilibacillus senegalensis]